MRVYGPNGTALATTRGAARRSASGTFSLSESDTSRNSGAAASLRSVGSLDALIALQGVEDATERRKKAVARGRNALDELEKLKVSLLDGSIGPATLARLKVAAEGLGEPTGNAGLDRLLGEIELRVAVELAKAGSQDMPGTRD